VNNEWKQLWPDFGTLMAFGENEENHGTQNISDLKFFTAGTMKNAIFWGVDVGLL
jgi:hypothetical protein